MTAAISEAELRNNVRIYLECGKNAVQTSIQLGIPTSTLQARIRRAAQRGVYDPETNTLSELVDDASKLEQTNLGLKDQIRALELQLKTTKRENLSADVVRTEILKLAEYTPNPPKWTLHPPKSNKSACVVATIWSDWHWGEVVNPAEVNWHNEYNLRIARKRAKRLVERIIDLCFNHMANPNYVGIVVNLGGDLVAGDIHEELTETNELPILPVLLDVIEVLIESLNQLADRFGKVYVPCVVGNHGRMHKKPRYKKYAHTNFDWLICSLLETHFKDDKRFKFDVPEGSDVYYSLFGHRYRLTHGDRLGSRGGDGIIGVIGPIIRGDVKTRLQSAAIGEAYETLLMGHYHTYTPLVPKLIVNGSLVGWSEYSKLAMRAPPELPQQALWIHHPKYGPIKPDPIFCEDPQGKTSKEWVSWPRSERS